ncbi:MAG TPA: ABC transporter permease subunit [Anaerolineales bacterium]|nr:ABC transporter permease subunit [Anaerolineales bacterium]
MKNRKSDPFRSLKVGIGVLLVLVVYAYGFQVTKVNLGETKSENRQQQLFRILRALAHPSIFEYEKDVFEVRVPVMIPCPEGGFEPDPIADKTQPHMVVTPACSDVRTNVHVEGFNFEPLTRGPLNLIPFESGVNLQLANIQIDRFGHFETTILLPNRPGEEAHELVAITRRNIGSPYLTQTAYDTWDKIIETVFMALLATTLGTIIAIPLSFIASRNLMKDVKSSLLGMSLSILLIPIGLYLGFQIADWSSRISQIFTGSVMLALPGAVTTPLVVWFGLRWALPQQEVQVPSAGVRAARMVVLLVASFLFIIMLYLVSFLMLTWGSTLEKTLGNFGFLGRFIRDLGDILNTVIRIFVGLGCAGAFSSLAARWGEGLSRRRDMLSRVSHHVLAFVAGAMLAIILMAIVNWFYQFRDINVYLAYAGGIGALFGLFASLLYKSTDAVPSGMIIYYVSRTIFNALRSIEALVMAIVFVVWVGIGPFAGVMALGLHTIVSLAKLYSEQVESIMAGPLEAIQATGANRLQTIMYAVIPQIIPPYISYTMYRWDINVRMSTIIGFVGGGGIGFLLQQNINLLNYRAASAQMLAIAIVVASMDYISSVLREKYV